MTSDTAVDTEGSLFVKWRGEWYCPAHIPRAALEDTVRIYDAFSGLGGDDDLKVMPIGCGDFYAADHEEVGS